MILVTGATGFVGSYLVRALVEQGLAVRALKRKESRIPGFLREYPQIVWHNADMLDLFSLEEALEGIEQVYHCAALVSFDPRKKKDMWATNVEGTANLVNLCLDLPVKKLVHVSSIAAMGEARSGELINEETHWMFNAQSDYSITKYESEREVWRGITEGLNAVIINPGVILGYDEQMRGNMKLVERVQRGLYYYTDGTVGFVDVKDVVRSMISLMNSDLHAERYILVSENLAYKDILFTIADELNVKRPRKKVSPFLLKTAAYFNSLYNSVVKKEPELTRYVVRTAFKKYSFDNQKIKKATGIDFIPVRDTIAELTGLYKQRS